MERSVQLILFLAAFVASFAIGVGNLLLRPRLDAEPDLIWMAIGVSALVGFLAIVAMWSAIGPIIYWRRFFTLVGAIALAVGFGFLGYFGFPPWQ